ncbi:MAG: RDD family protein [Acidimicrobiales bacterium]
MGPASPDGLDGLDGLARAAVGRRVAAAWIDVVLLGVLAFAFTERVDGGGGAGRRYELSGGPLLLVLAMWLVYYGVAELLCATTPGKWVMGLRVVGRDGRRPTAGAVAIRTVFRVIDGFPALYLVGFVVVLATGTTQRVGDLVAGTRVVKASDLRAPGAGRARAGRTAVVMVLAVAAVVAMTAVGFSRSGPDDTIGRFEFDDDVVPAVEQIVPLLFSDDDGVLAWFVPEAITSGDLSDVRRRIDEQFGAWQGRVDIDDHRVLRSGTIPDLGLDDVDLMQVRVLTAFENTDAAELVLTFTDRDGQLQLVRFDLNAPDVDVQG